MKLSFLSMKGGVGKSTLARLVSVFATEADMRVLLADLDVAQGTSTEWYGMRCQYRGDTPGLDVMRFRSVKPALDREGYDLTVIDGPAHAERQGLAAAKESDLIVLPAGVGMDDLMPQVRLAHELIGLGVPVDRIRIALCRVRASDTELRQIDGWLRSTGIHPFSFHMRELPSIRQAQNIGNTAAEAAVAPRLRAEMTAVAAEIFSTVIETVAAA